MLYLAAQRFNGGHVESPEIRFSLVGGTVPTYTYRGDGDYQPVRRLAPRYESSQTFI